MHVVFIYGPAAAGKYTIGTALSEELGIPLFHNHLTVDLAKSLFEFGSVGFNNLRAEVWRASFREAANEGVSFIFTFHPEATVEPSLISNLSKIIEEAGGIVFYVELECSHDTILNRIQLESRSQFGKLTDPVLYQRIYAEGGFELAGIPKPDIRIDTESVDPLEAARLIVEALDNLGIIGGGKLTGKHD